MCRKTQTFNDLLIESQRLVVDHTGGRRIGEFFFLHAGESVHQIFRDHQEVRRMIEPSLFLIVVELIDRIERLKLTARVFIELFKRNE